MRIRRILMISRAELVILITVIFNMVVKPSGNAGWFWGMLVVMLVGVAAVLAIYFRGGQRVPVTATD
jgi:Na+/melibiose symporter-like transporter